MTPKEKAQSALVAVGMSIASVAAFSGTWRDMHGAPAVQQIDDVKRAPKGQTGCLARVTFAASVNKAARDEGAVDKRWSELVRVPCARMGNLLAGAAVIDDSARPAAWPQSRLLDPAHPDFGQ